MPGLADPSPSHGAHPLHPERATRRPRVLVVDADHLLAELIDEWLSAEGCEVRRATDAEPFGDGPFALAIVDLPNPRLDGHAQVSRVAQHHPECPILALSTNFFAGIECHGPVARSLGASCVLAKPLAHEALVRAARDLIGR